MEQEHDKQESPSQVVFFLIMLVNLLKATDLTKHVKAKVWEIKDTINIWQLFLYVCSMDWKED